MFGTLVWNLFVWICWLGHHPNSFFVYIWVRKTLTLQYMCILVGSSQFCGWFSFGWKISGENGKNWPFMQKSQMSTGTER